MAPTKPPVDHVLVRAGQTILRAYAANPTTPLRIYDLESVADRCLAGDSGKFTAVYLAGKLRRPWPKPEARENRQDVLNAIFKHHPLAGLNALFGREDGPDPDDDAVWTEDDGEDVFGPRVLDTVAPAILQQWTAASPTKRAPLLAQHLKLINIQDDNAQWKPMALWLLEPPAISDEVLAALRRRFYAGVGNGKPEDQRRLQRQLSVAISGHRDERVRAWALDLASDADSRLEHWKQLRAENKPRFE